MKYICNTHINWVLLQSELPSFVWCLLAQMGLTLDMTIIEEDEKSALMYKYVWEDTTSI